MSITAALPVFFMFLVWGIKPGPHTFTLLVRSATHGVLTGFSIAVGNNIVHIIIFWGAFYTANTLVPSDRALSIVGLLAGIYIILFSTIDSVMYKNNPISARNSTTFISAFVAGLGVGLANPLNLSFYLAVIPELASYSFNALSAFLVSLTIFGGLMLGQSVYIGLADISRNLFENAQYRMWLFYFSNMLFGLFGVYIVIQSGARIWAA